MYIIMEFNYYSLVIYPNIHKKKINLFRKKYDPLINIIEPHITIIFPVRVPTNITEHEIISHIEKILSSWKEFNIEIRGLKLSWDNWLFLLLKDGNIEVIKLHDELYSGRMNKFLRRDIKFVPHIAIGLFVKSKNYDLRNPNKLELDKEKYETALKEAKKIDMGYTCKVNKLSLIKLNSELKKCKLIKEFII